METEKRMLIKIFKSVSSKYIEEPKSDKYLIKNSEYSEFLRQNINSLFLKNDLEPEYLWSGYSLSIATAPEGSEAQALAYGNRSAVFFRLSKFSECIKDIDRALSITKAHDIKTKLLCRKIKCLAATGSSDEIELTLQKAKCFYNDSETSKQKALQNLIQEAENTLINSNNPSSEKLTKDSHASVLQLKKDFNDFDFVSIEYDVKYGDHLIATRDINPGEVIFLEKPYVAAFSYELEYNYCSHCFIFCWSMIPCESCNCCMFCSEKCKKEAWNQYHSDQCTILALCKSNDKLNCLVQATLQVTLSALREVGSLPKLKNDLQQLDKYEGNYLKDNFLDNKFQSNKLKTLYCIKRLQLSEDLKLNYEIYANKISEVIIILAKFTTFFGKFFSEYECKYLMKNDDVLFIGSLLIKIMIIITNLNCMGRMVFNYESTPCHLGYFNRYILSTFINHSCDPNVVVACSDPSENSYTVVYAVKPIKSNEQIFESYFSKSFYDEKKHCRQQYIETLGFTCECEACIKNWPEYFMSKKPQEYLNQHFKIPLENELLNQYSEIINLVENDSFVDEMIEKLSNGVKIGVMKGSYPFAITCLLISCLKKVFNKTYKLHSLEL